MQTVDPKIRSNETMLFFIANFLIVTTPILKKFPNSLRTKQLKQVKLVTLLKPLGIVRHCYVFFVTQQLKQRRFYGRETSNECEQLF
jgi:hypothetical protein